MTGAWVDRKAGARLAWLGGPYRDAVQFIDLGENPAASISAIGAQSGFCERWAREQRTVMRDGDLANGGEPPRFGELRP